MKKVMKRLLALLMGMAVLFTAIPCNEVLATEENIPAITVTSTTVTAGNYAYFYVNASNFTDMVGLEYILYYDADVMSLNWIYAGSFLSSSTNVINKDTAGEIKCSFMNVDGLNGNGQLLRMGFQVSADAEPGTYPITLTIGDAYDSNFTEISIAKKSGILTVNSSEPTATSISFYTACDKTTVNQGETFTYTLKAGYTYGLACGNFEFQYDRDLLELVDVNLGKELLTETAIYHVNKDTAGYVKITYADIEAISSSYGIEYFKLTFTVKENVDITTNIEFAADSLVDANLANMKTNSLTRKITIAKSEEEVIYPALKVKVSEIASDGSFTADLILEAGSNVAAGDFTIAYDQSQIVCQSVERDAALTANGGYLITKENINEGNVQFSYVNQHPFTEEQRIAVLQFQANETFYGDTVFHISGKDVVNVNYADITLEYDSVTVEIPVRMISLNCTSAGKTYYIGDDVTLKDFKVIAVYNNDSKKEISEGYSISAVDTTTAGEKVVEIAYQHLSTTCNVLVETPIIEISQESASIIAGYADKLIVTTAPAVDTVVWSSSDETVATVADGVVKGLKVGNVTITAQFTYNGIVYTDTCNVEVTEAILEGIELENKPTKTEYWIGDVLDTTGLSLKLTYSDGTTTFISEGYEVSGFDSQSAGDKTLTVKYKEFSIKFEITVLNYIIGDVNNDGEVNNLDRQILTRHLANWEGYEAETLNMQMADVNKDGEVNNLDRQILTRHLANWEGYKELPYAN